MSPIARYTRWLHGRWPAGTVERLPVARDDGTTNVPGVYVAGDLRGIPLLKLATESGAEVVRAIAEDPGFLAERKAGVDALDVVVVGGGVAGMAAALEARARGLSFRVLESNEPFSTIANFPKRKPIYTYPKDLDPASPLRVTAGVKEELLAELRRQAVGIETTTSRAERVRRKGSLLEVTLADGGSLLARRVVVALGQSGEFRRLGVPGEDLDKVYNRLHDPKDYAGKRVLVVGGGDSALETAAALADAGASVTLSYRGAAFARPKAENVAHVAAAPGLRVALGTTVQEIGPEHVALVTAGAATERVGNDVVFVMIGREAPLDFFRRSGIAIRGERNGRFWATLAFSLACFAFLYHWKAGGPLTDWFAAHRAFPFNLPAGDPATLLGTIVISFRTPGAWYSLAYTAAILFFGARRIRRRRTPYVAAQTVTLMAVQVLPLFLLPYVLLPWAGHRGLFDGPHVAPLADALFPRTQWDPQGREYWRAFGFILAWPLFLWNVFTSKPNGVWLTISLLQTFVIVPWIVWRWGKGAYCGWICSCGALAETMGDTHRAKMPHGPAWNRVNLVGQAILAVAFGLLVLRVVGWALPWDHPLNGVYSVLLTGKNVRGTPLPFPMTLLNYEWIVDLFLAGIVGTGLYFHFSGRVWCRFACPLAAWMHVVARFSRFRILADKKKCISCSVCTSVCHQGIDVMSFANKGLPMEDPECVRCSACVQSCPTGVLTFGGIDPKSGRVVGVDRLAASAVQVREGAR
ncbi:MAG: NAD(P)-binding domain-containing protein [bacterium]